MRDHDPIKIVHFNGVLDRGEDEVVPVDHFRSARNVKFTNRGVQTRSGFDIHHAHANIANVRRIDTYTRPGEAQRDLILNNVGQLFDDTSLGVPILDIPTMTDFMAVSLFGRAYITPCDGNVGLPGEKVYVYSGSGTARPAGGPAPTGFQLTAADSLTSGKVEGGFHIYAVVFETNTGFMTRPGGHVGFTPVGGRKLDIGNVAIGPAYVVARHIIATKVIASYNGDLNNQEWFFVPFGELPNNTATTIVLDFYDADLQADANYLLDQLEIIPAGVGIGQAHGRMLVWGEDANQSTVRVSKSGDPESFDATEGFFNVNPADAGGGVKKCFAHRGSIYALKSQRTYGTQDNGENAALWDVDEIDMSVGTDLHGVARVLDFGESLEDIIFVADRAGLRFFNGTFAQQVLTYKIDDVWGRINKAAFNKVQITVDPIGALVYCALPLDGAAEPNALWIGDYNDGLTAEAIKWAPWVTPKKVTTLLVDVDATNKETVFKYGSSEGNIHVLGSGLNDYGTAIESWVEFALVPNEDMNWDEGEYDFGSYRMMIRGVGDLIITGEGIDAVKTVTAPLLSLSNTPGGEITGLLEFIGNRLSIKLRLDGINEYFRLNKFVLYAAKLWE